MGMAAVHRGEFKGIVGKVNLITAGAVYRRMNRPLGEPARRSAFDTLFPYVHSESTVRGLQNTNNLQLEGNPVKASTGVYNLDGALNW